MGIQKNLTGQRFGKLVVIEQDGKDKYSRSMWKCLCDCGNYTTVMIGNLTSGNTQSCGCGHDGHPTHKQTKTRLFNIWQKMKDRCCCSTSDAYMNYGARGIIVCDEWKNSFLCFKKWATENGYNETLTLERKDVNGNYCPENCCWIPKGEQANNKRNTLRFKGKTLKEITLESGLKYASVNAHYHRGDLSEWLNKKGFAI